ncbi:MULTISPECIES: alanine dehydrogenase [Maribacter]|uniref:Alanine dehydrogenase n=1 Tax=Maribacter dokdonensis TaxID=320912 RepID=A0A1H4K7G5_9FLAO|nr:MULTISPECIES: alanine dehydrogenase [Maribacter]HAF76140.1 alanine dehydrogenase [Maribacter sp.]APA63963.1 alanine dehydrogenase [Maribacter sp. 1_2014MBL_MicDiv]MBU2900953.1 alanine dehydrogenase [Maribacter dokdonensis]MDP2526154.1 alanine dehydrogenase [Maribacter dokdonensis]PHN95301.1 alanine dehydrogenase [Maribacter sp. 6B07]|tara:strand:+ start:27134 stop:28234 length:1101 start_codon:yes stop_codon:yes gene_type:complete
MIVGIPKEIKNNESRVGMTPAGVFELVKNNHKVYVQSEAGEGSGFFNQDYQQAGAIILDTIGQVYAMSEMIVKVKEPIEEEYDLIQAGQILFTYFHFASSEALTKAMIKQKAICIAYETVEDEEGTLPLLTPMSEVAGRMAIQQGAKYLEKPVKGRGVLLGGVPGVAPGKVLVLGAGVVGIQAAKMAAGLGAHVTILDINMKRLRYVNDVMPPHVVTEFSNEFNIRKLIKTHDLIIGGVLLKGAKAPNLITRDMLKEMRPGTVIVDVAVDQGGCVETTRPTTHEDPIYIIDDVVHYSVANMPGAVPYTSTMALTNVTLPYALKLANLGWEAACEKDASLHKGLNIVEGKVVYQEIMEAFGWEEIVA